MPKVQVRAVLGRLYPHPNGKAGLWLGWRPAQDGEAAEHIIPRAPGIRQDGTQSADMYREGFETRLIRTEPVEVEETMDIRRAFLHGDLEKIEPAQEAPALPPLPRSGQRAGGSR